jgi:hypothetical protein
VALRETADDDGQILKAIDRLSGRLRERIGESLKTIRANEPLDQVTTSSLEALRLYTEGARASDAGESSKAVSLLKQAVALDSGFAMAWRKLAAALANSRASLAEQTAAATKAYQNRDRHEVERCRRRPTTSGRWIEPQKAITAYRQSSISIRMIRLPPTISRTCGTSSENGGGRRAWPLGAWPPARAAIPSLR